MNLFDKIAPYWKAIIAFFAPGATLVIAAMQDTSLGGSTIVQNEWITALATCVITSATVAAKGNKDRTGTHQDESVQPPENRTAFAANAQKVPGKRRKVWSWPG